MYYVFCADFDKTTSSILSDDSTCHEPIWQNGRMLANGTYDFSKLCFLSETPHISPFPDYSRDGHGCPVFSDKLKNIMEAAGCDNIEYFPAQIVEYNSSEPQSGYYAANIIGLIQCIDMDESEVDEDEDGNIDEIEHLVIDESATRDLLIFRLAEMQDVILIHEHFKKPIEEAGITGVSLVPCDQWDGFDGFK